MSASLKDFQNKFPNVDLGKYDLCDAFGLIIVPKDELLEERHNALTQDDWNDRYHELQDLQQQEWMEQQAHLQNENHIQNL